MFSEEQAKLLSAPYLRPSEFTARMKETPILYLPIGSIEWHNEHLPMGTDTLHATELCLRLCGQLGGVVLPGFWWNTGQCHHHAATYYLEEKVFFETLRNVCLGFGEMPCKLLVLINGHGGKYQNDYLPEIARSLNEEGLPYQTIAVDPYHFGAASKTQIDHADTGETSLSMELIGPLVQMERRIVPDLYSKQYPFQSGLPNREDGAELWECFLQDAVKEIQAAL